MSSLRGTVFKLTRSRQRSFEPDDALVALMLAQVKHEHTGVRISITQPRGCLVPAGLPARPLLPDLYVLSLGVKERKPAPDCIAAPHIELVTLSEHSQVMPSVTHQALASLRLALARVREQAREVVQAIAMRLCVVEYEAAADEFAEMFVPLVFTYRCFRSGVERRGEDRETAEDARGVRRKTLVAQVEGGFDADVNALSPDILKARALVAELRGVLFGVEVNRHVEQASRRAYGERKIAAQVTNTIRNIVGDTRADSR